MSPKLPLFTSRELVQLLQQYGFELHHQTGSHAAFRHADGRRVTVPIHTGKTTGRGLLRKILRDADIDPDTLRK